MGKIWMPGGGAGADLDIITAGAGDVLSGKVIVDKDGNPLPGTLALSGNASDSQVLAGSTYYSTDPKSKRTGTMPNYGKTPTQINNIRINNNRFEVAVAAGYHGEYWANNGYEFMSFDQVANAIGLTAAKLKKGEVVCGKTGTFEGYVPTANDLYLRGNAASITGGFRSGSTYVDIETGQIVVKKTTLEGQSPNGYYYGPCTYNKINLKGYNYVNVEFTVESAVKNLNVDIALTSTSHYQMQQDLHYLTYARANTGLVNNKVISVPVAAFQQEAYIFVGVSYSYQETHRVVIYRIWLS